MSFTKFLLLTLATLISTMLAGCDSEQWNRPAVTLESIQVLTAEDATDIGAEVSLTVGDSQALIALGRYSDGSSADLTDSVNWRSDNAAIAAVDADGRVEALSQGRTRISASLNGITSNAVTVAVTDPVLTSIQVTPAVVELPRGNSQQFTALGRYNDGSTADLTNSVNWASDDTDIASVDTLGELKAVAIGSTTVTASLGDIVSNRVAVTVTNAVLTAIQVTPPSASLPKGNSRQLTALGTFSDGSTLDLTDSVSWSSDSTAIATVDTLGELTAVDLGNTTISASRDDVVSNRVAITVTSAILTGIQVTPPSANLPKGNTQPLAALGTYSDGTTADLTNSVAWTSSDTAIAAVDSQGALIAVDEGNATISASQDAIVSNTVTVTVSSAVLTDIQVTPAVVSLPKGNAQQLTALGTYSDGTRVDLTDSVDWHIGDTAIATLDMLGELVAVGEGSTTAFASSAGMVSNTVTITVTGAELTSIQVTPASVDLAKGNTQQLTALGRYTDGSSADITDSVDWHSDNTAVATLDRSGELTAVEEGSTTASASWGDIVSNTVTVTVSGAVLTAIQVTPPAPSLAKGNRQQLTAMGTYSDGSTDDVTNAVAWNSGDTAIATVDSQGELTAVDEGDTTISASWEGIVSNTVTVTVSGAVLTAIQVTPPAPSLAKGNRQQLTAMGTFSDGTTADLTTSVAWTSSDTHIATVDSSGQLTAVDEGTATVSASKEGVVSNTVTVIVTPAVLTAIQVTPATVDLAKGNAQQLTALGRYSDGTIVTLTSVNWHSGDTAVATVDMEGQLTAVEEGNTTAYARLGGIVSNTVTVNVTGAVLTSIQVTPPAPSLAKGNTQQLTAQGTFSDGTTADLTSSVAWISSDTDIVTVDSSGQLTAVDEGTATVSASKEGIVSNTATVTITGAVLTAIQVTPASNSLAKGTTQQLTAQGTFSDGTTADLTDSVSWSSSDTHIVTVDSGGQLTAVDEGSATVSTSKDGVAGNPVAVTVTPAALTGLQVIPASASLALGSSEPLFAEGTFSDGTTANVTDSVSWSSDDTAIARVDTQGKLIATGLGNTTVSASQDGIVSNTVAVTVTAAVLTAIQVTPSTVSLARGNRLQLSAQGTFSNGSTADITSSANWNSDDNAIATVDSQGEVTAVGVGGTTVSASQDGIVSNTVTLTVPSLEKVQDVTLNFEAVKRFRFDWTEVAGASHYRLLENPDGISGFSPVGEEVTTGTLPLEVPLYARTNAQYILQACAGRGAGELCIDSDPVSVSGTLVGSIGYFKASNTDRRDGFGSSVSLSADGRTLAVGASRESSNAVGINPAGQSNNAAVNAGAVYLFVQQDGSWVQEAYIKASNTDTGDSFGGAVSLSADGNTLAVGAFGEQSNATGVNGTGQEVNPFPAAGAVYTFTRDDDGWVQQAYIKPSNTDAGMSFGSSLSLSADGNTLAVGAAGEDNQATGVSSQGPRNGGARDSGAVYVFAQNNGIWAEQAYIKASNSEANDLFGRAVSLSADGNTLAVGANGEDSPATGVNGNQGNDFRQTQTSGAVYLFSRDAVTGWDQEAYIKASNTGEADFFGTSVSLSADGNTLAVGAEGEDSNVIGIDADQQNNNAFRSGAVYVFSRDAVIGWDQRAYIKASNTDTDDGFGAAVSLSADGNTLAVRAIKEDSRTTGVNANSLNNAASRSGAVYVFRRNAGSWFEQAYVKASNTDIGDEFGSSVSLSGDGNTLAVGAPDEDSDATGIGNDQSNSADDPFDYNAGAVYVY
ncbi:Ig-like domain-containing protein [Microbulbifer spongiae]|uniref:Ig-like domain-containing protein n=1 Tax=Microbulbifer spongiae TaxID=2944933 RepID=A0ABY9EB08_9GAMM|nr:Ig-like domain-containing protein [Microbulbifer sp. MI-G]WKD50175.1 Ig-like domain-containing protein [Microbulbifer sp. MI-G]